MSKYKSPLSRSRNTSANAINTSQTNIVEQANKSLTDNSFQSVFIHDNRSMQPSPVTHQWRGRGNSSPRFNSPRFSSPRLNSPRLNSPRFNNPKFRGSPYQWTPNKYNNSSISDHNNSTYDSSYEQNNCSSFGQQQNTYKNQYSNKFPNRSYENRDESYFHPSMLEDPWASLLNSSENNSGICNVKIND